ncbi:hypothetical protein Pmani_027865 [Petrolisthes manimaculis]|uniref:Uncharacterized protein n=1 Tax=Petrolisthes manimaculis TaxID=1843537 RepID=A0AAE1P256_9EUCA|nr:hypothetical protein Pmani_027865 [Petrolisthes manimaculis]
MREPAPPLLPPPFLRHSGCPEKSGSVWKVENRTGYFSVGRSGKVFTGRTRPQLRPVTRLQTPLQPTTIPFITSHDSHRQSTTSLQSQPQLNLSHDPTETNKSLHMPPQPTTKPFFTRHHSNQHILTHATTANNNPLLHTPPEPQQTAIQSASSTTATHTVTSGWPTSENEQSSKNCT